MSLRFNGDMILKICTSKPLLSNFIIPSTVNFQIRNAARKGYREKAKKKHMAQKLSQLTPQKEVFKIKQKFTKIEKTVEPQKPDPPNDSVFIASDFKHVKYSLIDAIKFHQEYHHPTVFNNPFAPIYTRIEFNMIGKKKTQVLKPFKGLAAIPHPFNTELKREVLVFCDSEYVEEAVECGGTVVGGTEIVNKVKTGYILPNLFEYIVCHTQFLPYLTPIRGILKAQMPRPKNGTLTNNFRYTIPRLAPHPPAIYNRLQSIIRFLYGIEYNCVKLNANDDFGVLDCQIGNVSMKPEHVEENLKALLKDIQQFRPQREGNFVSWIWCRSPPSKEEFSLDVSLYEESKKEFDSDDEEEEVGLKKEKRKRFVAEKGPAEDVEELDSEIKFEDKI